MTPHPFDERIIARLSTECDAIDDERASGNLKPNWKQRHNDAYEALGRALTRAASNARKSA